MAMQVVRYVIVVPTILTGVVSLFWPLRVQGFIGLTANGGRGITEIRSVLGAVFVGLGIGVLLFNAPEAYKTLGVMYLTMAVVRGISIFVDDSMESSNVISVVAELAFGVLLLL